MNVKTTAKLLLALTLGSVASAQSAIPNFGNVTVTVAGDAGQNLLSFEKYADIFKKAGITIKTVGIPFTSVYEKEKAEFVAGTGAYDLVIFYPSYIGDFAGNDYLEPLDAYTTKQPAATYDPKLSDVIKAYRELYLKWDNKLYALPYDGDVHVMYYRKDLFSNPAEKAAYKAKYGKELAPPTTWTEWNQIATFFNRKAGQKLAGQILKSDFHGVAEYGQRGFSYAWFLDRFGSAGGLYFDKDMKPQINSPAGIRSLESMITSVKASPKDVLGYGYEELKNAFLNGQVAMVVQWADVGKKAQDTQLSKVVGKVGFGLVPGTLVGGKVVHRSATPVGRVMAIPKDAKNKDAAYWVAKVLSADKGTETVASTWSGEDPYRVSQFASTKPYSMFKNSSDASAYLKAVRANLEVAYPEINIPGAAQYIDALDLNVNKALAGQVSAKAALDATAKAWDDITDQLGRDNQKKFWASALTTYRNVGLLK
ncbi:MAG: extracellular solute-binding protein [Deinococcus sp.]